MKMLLNPKLNDLLQKLISLQHKFTMQFRDLQYLLKELKLASKLAGIEGFGDFLEN